MATEGAQLYLGPEDSGDTDSGGTRAALWEESQGHKDREP